MIKYVFLVLPLVLMSDVGASAVEYNFSSNNFITNDGALICKFEFQLKEATQAIISGDDKWLKELECMKTRGGLKAIKIYPEGNKGGNWKMRIFNTKGDGFTVWGSYHDFTPAP